MVLSQKTLDFLKDLGQNNNREWFLANKKRYETEVKKPFEELVGQMIRSFQRFDDRIQLQPKDAIFRINRDIRFSQDKSPYKTHLSAVISPKGRKGKEYPGFYFQLEYGALMMGGGAYFLEKDTLGNLRRFIVRHPDRFRKLATDPDFLKYCGPIQGEKNKILPAELKAAAEKEPLLYNKQFYYMAEMDPALVLKRDFIDLATTHFKAAQALNAFLAEGMGY